MESILLERVSPNPSNLHSSLTEHSPISIIEPKFLINSFAFLIDTPFMLVSKSSRRSSVDNLYALVVVLFLLKRVLPC